MPPGPTVYPTTCATAPPPKRFRPSSISISTTSPQSSRPVVLAVTDQDKVRNFQAALLGKIQSALTKGDLRPPDPPSGTGANRGAHLHRLPRLLSARHPRAAPERARAGPDPAQRVREIRRRADDRRPHPHRRRPRTAADPLHPAGARADAPPPPPQARPARPAAPQNHLSPSRRRAPPVVPTFRGSAQRFQRVPTSDMAQSANFGQRRSGAERLL